MSYVSISDLPIINLNRSRMLAPKSNVNTRKLSRNLLNAQKQLDRGGKFYKYRFRNGRLEPAYLKFNDSQKAMRKSKIEYVEKMFGCIQRLYNEQEPAIATVNEQGVFRYVPLSKTNLLPIEITRLKQGIID